MMSCIFIQVFADDDRSLPLIKHYCTTVFPVDINKQIGVDFFDVVKKLLSDSHRSDGFLYKNARRIVSLHSNKYLYDTILFIHINLSL